MERESAVIETAGEVERGFADRVYRRAYTRLILRNNTLPGWRRAAPPAWAYMRKIMVRISVMDIDVDETSRLAGEGIPGVRAAEFTTHGNPISGRACR